MLKSTKAFAALLMIALAGCTSVKTPDDGFWPWSSKPKESLYETPVRMVVTWSYNILTMPGKLPAPGFGGRLYFYNNKGQAVPVDGQLVVYAYDDTEVVEPGAPPRAKFAFTADQFTQHFKETDLGASYSVWVPISWHDHNGPSRSVSLIPVFTSAKGNRLVGKQSLNLLPGRKKAHDENFPERFIRRPDGSLVPDESEPSTYFKAAVKSFEKRSNIRTTTIPMSEGLTKQARRRQTSSGALAQQIPLPQHSALQNADHGLRSRPIAGAATSPAGRLSYSNDPRIQQVLAEAAGRPALNAHQVQLGMPVLAGTSASGQRDYQVQPASASLPNGEVTSPTSPPSAPPEDRSGSRRFQVQGARVVRPDSFPARSGRSR